MKDAEFETFLFDVLFYPLVCLCAAVIMERRTSNFNSSLSHNQNS